MILQANKPVNNVLMKVLLKTERDREGEASNYEIIPNRLLRASENSRLSFLFTIFNCTLPEIHFINWSLLF